MAFELPLTVLPDVPSLWVEVLHAMRLQVLVSVLVCVLLLVALPCILSIPFILSEPKQQVPSILSPV